MNFILKIAITDEAGKALAGIPLKVAGNSGDLKTNADGLCQFLLPQGGFDLKVNGTASYSGHSDNISGLLTLKLSADGNSVS